MIDKKLNVFERQDLKCLDIEAVWCEIFEEKTSFIEGSIYIPPDDEQMLNKLCSVVDSLIQDKKTCFCWEILMLITDTVETTQITNLGFIYMNIYKVPNYKY